MALAIVATVTNRSLAGRLLEILPPLDVQAVLNTTDVIASLPATTQALVRGIFSDEYNTQMKIMIGFAVAQFPAIALM